MTASRLLRTSATVTLRRGRIGDLDALDALERELFANRLFAGHLISRESFRRFLKRRRSTLIVAEVADKVVGYVLILYRSNSRLARLYSMGIAAQFRRQGLARRLLQAAEREAVNRRRHAVRLEVRDNDRGAIALYNSSGYRSFDKRPGYYDKRVAALLFEKSLQGIHTPA